MSFGTVDLLWHLCKTSAHDGLYNAMTQQRGG